MKSLFQLLCALLCASATVFSAEPTFRTDGGNEKLPWFQLRAGEFPPEGSAHYIAGELIAADHFNRTGVLRLDRTDAQRRSDWDLPHAFTMLPYGSISYHGAVAEMRDLPIGTHLHGWFYAEEPAPKTGKPNKVANVDRVSLEAEFNRVLRFEDDFSHFTRLQRAWRVDAVDLEKNTLTVTGITAGKADAKPAIFVVSPATRVWKGRGTGSLSDLAAGQSVLINITVATLKGPGRCVEIWLDDDSRVAATAHQSGVHWQFMRDHGFAGWIDAVDNHEGTVTVTLFANFDPKLKEMFRLTGTTNDTATACVAEDNLRTWDQINDRKAGPILEAQNVAPAPGNSGVRIKLKPAVLLEGFRPKRIVRLFPSAWKVDDLPREERMYH